MANKIESILAERQKQQQAETPGDKFFQMNRVEGAVESYLELRFRDGIQTAFKYDDLAWFNYDPARGIIDLEFMGFAVTIEGRGFSPDLFQAIKSRRVSWVKEADSEMQDNPEITLFISNITILPPEDFGGEKES